MGIIAFGSSTFLLMIVHVLSASTPNTRPDPGEAPHDTMGGKTPNEVYFSRPPENEQSRFEPRKQWPRGSPRAKPRVGIHGNPGDPVILEIDCHKGRRHLPIIRARHAA